MTPMYKKLIECRAILLSLNCPIPTPLEEEIEKAQSSFRTEFENWLSEQSNIVDYHILGERKLKAKLAKATQERMESKVNAYRNDLKASSLKGLDISSL